MTTGSTFQYIPTIISMNTSFCFLILEGVSSKISSIARKACLINAEGFNEFIVVIHLVIEVGGGRHGDVFTLKEKKSNLHHSSLFILSITIWLVNLHWLSGNVAFLSKVMLF